MLKVYGFLCLIICGFLPLYSDTNALLEKQFSSLEKEGNTELLLQRLQQNMEAICQTKHSGQKAVANEALNVFYNSLKNPFRNHYFGLPNVSDFIRVAWDVYPKFVRAKAILEGFSPEIDSQYSNNGYKQGVFSEEISDHLLQTLERAKIIPMMEEDYDEEYHRFIGFYALEDYYNTHNKFVMLEEEQYTALRPVLESLKDPVSKCLGSAWRVVNIRSWRTHPRDLQNDPNGGWHRDGFPYSAVKIMIYPQGASYPQGTTEFQEGHGLNHVKGPKGTWFLFKNSEIHHRAIAPKLAPGVQDRLIVELTIVPSLSQNQEPICAGLNASWPYFPWHDPSYQEPLTPSSAITCINIGGGSGFRAGGWLNLEAVASASNPVPFRLYPNCKFPLHDRSIEIAFTSHVLEHLNEPTVFRTLSETARVLKKDGFFVIKIPDYDQALDCWKRCDMSFFGEYNWGFPIYTWHNRNVADSIDARAAMIFYSFATQEFGPLFSGRETDKAPGAYFGPPAVGSDFLQALIQDRTPSEIVKELRKIVMSSEFNAQLCHQSAWNRSELTRILDLFNFEVVSFDKDFIITRFSQIPGIQGMKEHSMYCLAKKKK